LASRHRIRLLGSERIIPLYTVKRIQLAGNCEVRDVKVAVLPKSTRRIMGLSALRQLAPFSVSFDPPMLTVNGCQPSTAALESAPAEKIAAAENLILGSLNMGRCVLTLKSIPTIAGQIL